MTYLTSEVQTSPAHIVFETRRPFRKTRHVIVYGLSGMIVCPKFVFSSPEPLGPLVSL